MRRSEELRQKQFEEDMDRLTDFLTDRMIEAIEDGRFNNTNTALLGIEDDHNSVALVCLISPRVEEVEFSIIETVEKTMEGLEIDIAFWNGFIIPRQILAAGNCFRMSR